MKKLLLLITGFNLIALIIGINVVLTFLGSPKFDVTESKIYSLSKPTKDLIKKVDDVINIDVYLSKELPSEIKPAADNLKNTLKVIQKINSAKIKINYIDPTGDVQKINEAQNFGISPLQFSSTKNDKFEIQSTYYGMVIEYGTKKELVPIAMGEGNLEYLIASTISRLTTKELPEVLMSSATTQVLNKYLGFSYKVTPVDLTSDKTILDDKAKSLVIIGQKNKINDKVLSQIEKWVDTGKGVIIFEDKIFVNNSMVGSTLGDVGLDKLKADNGILIENKLVMDQNSSIAQFRTNNGTLNIQYLYWPLIRTENINNLIPALNGITNLSLQWASPLKINERAEKMFLSSGNSVATDSWQNLTPQNNKIVGNKESFVLGAISKNKKMAVVGDADFISDQFVTSNQRNLLLALNLIDYMSSENNLTEIRAKTIDPKQLKELTSNQKTLVRVINLAAPIISLLIIYLTIYAINKRKTDRN